MSKQSATADAPESRLAPERTGEPLLLQIRSDRRLGHEWDDWDGEPLADGGLFLASEGLFFRLLYGLVGGLALVVAGIGWLIAPRLAVLGATAIAAAVWISAILLFGFLVWSISLAIILRTGRNWMPSRLAERGLIPWLMPLIERFARLTGISRDRSGNAALRVYNGLMAARSRKGVSPEELLILLPRCLGKDAMQAAMSVSERYGVPLFVAARGRYARQMIAMRRPKGVVAIACERDLVSGVHDVAAKLPVLGTTLALPDGPCRNTEFAIGELEGQVRTMLGLQNQ